MTDPANSIPLDDLGQHVVSGPANDLIFREGDAGTDLYLIQQGRIEISVTVKGEAKCITVLESGDFFGEESMLDGGPRPVSARATTDYKLLKIAPSSFAKVVRERPEIAIQMLVSLSTRLRKKEEAAVVGAGARAPLPAHPVAVSAYSCFVHRESGKEFPLSHEGETTVGRADRTADFVPDVDLSSVDPERSLSRRHARVVKGDAGFYLVGELGARNGTLVNGQRLDPAMPVRIDDGDEIQFGLVRVQFRSR
jgi:hypothetical protein